MGAGYSTDSIIFISIVTHPYPSQEGNEMSSQEGNEMSWTKRGILLLREVRVYSPPGEVRAYSPPGRGRGG